MMPIPIALIAQGNVNVGLGSLDTMEIDGDSWWQKTAASADTTIELVLRHRLITPSSPSASTA